MITIPEPEARQAMRLPHGRKAPLGGAPHPTPARTCAFRLAGEPRGADRTQRQRGRAPSAWQGSAAGRPRTERERGRAPSVWQGSVPARRVAVGPQPGRWPGVSLFWSERQTVASSPWRQPVGPLRWREQSFRPRLAGAGGRARLPAAATAGDSRLLRCGQACSVPGVGGRMSSFSAPDSRPDMGLRRVGGATLGARATCQGVCFLHGGGAPPGAPAPDIRQHMRLPRGRGEFPGGGSSSALIRGTSRAVPLSGASGRLSLARSSSRTAFSAGVGGRPSARVSQGQAGVPAYRRRQRQARAVRVCSGAGKRVRYPKVMAG